MISVPLSGHSSAQLQKFSDFTFKGKFITERNLMKNLQVKETSIFHKLAIFVINLGHIHNLLQHFSNFAPS